MTSANSDVIAPLQIILPTASAALLASTDVQAGTIVFDGTDAIKWFNGTAWKTLSGDNTGD